MSDTNQTVVPRWEFKPGEAVLVRSGASVTAGTIAPGGYRVRFYYEGVDGYYARDLVRSHTVPLTTAGIHELKRQLACLEGEITATRNRLDGIYRECADAEGL